MLGIFLRAYRFPKFDVCRENTNIYESFIN